MPIGKVFIKNNMMPNTDISDNNYDYVTSFLLPQVIDNRPILSIPQRIRQISQNAPFCEGNVHTSAYFFNKKCSVRYGTSALWNLWNGSIISNRSLPVDYNGRTDRLMKTMAIIIDLYSCNEFNVHYIHMLCKLVCFCTSATIIQFVYHRKISHVYCVPTFTCLSRRI